MEANEANNEAQETLKDRYDVYVACASELGWEIKSFDEWLDS